MSQMLDLISLFTGHSLWEYITVFFDNIPKLIYFIYTAIASCLDMLQLVMRKLAGLDTYWIKGVAYTQQDPVLEFILGMLGLGQNAGIYSALSTVFWSIAIFGLIVLVLATMVAIIKSHYNEDSNKTNPLAYVYSAIKAIFTFAIVPVAVILGIYLSQFLLQTADNITAGKSDAETVRGIYGDRYSTCLADQGDGNYGRYDFFGFGSKANTTTISGMLFRTASYDANRIRYGDYSVEGMIKDNTSANKLFGDTTAPMKGQASDQDWIAYQIDYAFMNNLDYAGEDGVIWAEQLVADGYGVDNALVTIAGVDFFRFLGVSDGFSKYNVGLVWYYYYLWKFNFFVGFAAIAIAFGLLTSIIVGLMSRLIYSAALFLIYPGVLGLAPLDEWNAFKKWRQQFVSQLLMAFGSIIGMNIIFLILPYVNEFDWFGSSTLGVWGSGLLSLPSAIVNTLITITGLLLIKEFINFVSGLIGSTSAADTGDNTKKAMTPILAKAGKATLGFGNLAWKVGGAGMRMVGKEFMAERAAKKADRLQNGYDKEIGTYDRATKTWSYHTEHVNGISELEGAMPDDAKRADNMERAQRAMDFERGRFAKPGNADYDNLMKMTRIKADTAGVTDPAERMKMENEAIDNYLTQHSGAYAIAKRTVDNNGLTGADLKRQEKINGLKTQRQGIISQNYLDKYGQVDDETHKQIGRNIVRSIAGAILKGAKEVAPEIAGINTKAVTDVFHAGNNNKYDEKGNAVGSYTPGGLSNADYRSGNVSSLRETIKQGFGNVFSAAGAPAPSAEPTGDKAIREAAKDLSRAAADIKSATQDLKRFRPRP